MSAQHQPPAGSTGPSADDASIHLLADAVLDALNNDQISPSLVHVRRDGDTLDTDCQPFLDLHPRDYLLGYDVPPTYFAIGVAARGWAHHMDPDVEVTPERVAVVSIVSRSGEQAQATATANPDHPLNLIDEPPPSGEQIDLMRRSLGLATAPPPCEPGVYWSMEWLGSIVDDSVAYQRELDWPAARALHPSSRLMTLGGVDPGDHEFADLVASFGRACDWSRIRAMVDEGAYRSIGLDAGDGTWFDDGSLARYLLSRCAPLPDMLDDLYGCVTEPARRHIEHVLDQVGMPDRIWPDTFAS